MQLFSVNEEFLVSTISSECADYVPVLCTHRPSLLPIECFSEIFGLVFRAALGSFGIYRKDAQTGSFRGSKSRNKVFVGEPAYGSLPLFFDWFSIINKNFNFAQSSFIYIFDDDDCVAPLCHINKSYNIKNSKKIFDYLYCLVFQTFPLFNNSLLFVIEYESMNIQKNKNYNSVRWITRLVIRWRAQQSARKQCELQDTLSMNNSNASSSQDISRG